MSYMQDYDFMNINWEGMDPACTSFHPSRGRGAAARPKNGTRIH
jgi:hypothetical protein